MKKFTKSDLKCGDVIEYEHKYRIAVFANEKELSFINEHYDDELRPLNGELEIVSVYRNPLRKREELTITSDEKNILQNIDSNFRYIARDEDETLLICIKKPVKSKDYWLASSNPESFNYFRHLFKMVKWEDEEPWLIEDLLKLPEKEG